MPWLVEFESVVSVGALVSLKSVLVDPVELSSGDVCVLGISWLSTLSGLPIWLDCPSVVVALLLLSAGVDC